jgi:hypothetical protein
VLFDLDEDPHERTNLALDPAYAPVRDRLAGLLDAMQHAPRYTAAELPLER